MKFLSFVFFVLLFSQNIHSQDFSKLLGYKGFPISEVSHYYLSSKSVLDNESPIYSSVKVLNCDKSKYLGEIKNLSSDLESQFDDHLGNRKRSSPTQVHYFKNLRDAQISHRRATNNDRTIVDDSFVYYCKE